MKRKKDTEDIASASDSSYKTDAITDFDFGYTRYKCIASTEISDIERIFYVYNADRFDFNGTPTEHGYLMMKQRFIQQHLRTTQMIHRNTSGTKRMTMVTLSR